MLGLMNSVNGREINKKSGFEPCRARQDTELYSYGGSLRGLEGKSIGNGKLLGQSVKLSFLGEMGQDIHSDGKPLSL